MDFIPDSTVKKLILLFVLDKMEIPLSENSIIDICTSRNNWLKYLDCKEALSQLVDVKFICKLNNDADQDPRDIRYSITVEGRNCLSHFFNRIRQSIREEIAEYAKQNRMVFKRSQEYVYDYKKNTDGSHTVVFRIKEPLLAQPMFEIRLKTSTRNAAVNAGKKWCKKAAQIYEYVFENLISDN
ncbi:MAG: DUF4364 family protein [Clostridia bacterium]|nr:DUF4364 family protein [Clostridia bacterium]